MNQFTVEELNLIIESVTHYEKEQRVGGGEMPKEILAIGSLLTNLSEKELKKEFSKHIINKKDKKEDLAILKGKLVQVKRELNQETEMRKL